MKKILFALVVMSLAFYACDPEEPDFAATFSTNSFTETGSVTASKSMSAVLSNTSSTAGQISWSFTETATVTGWTYSVSVNGNVQSGTSGSFDLSGNSAATVIVTVSPNGTAGTGTASITFTESSKNVGTVTYSYTATAAPPAPNFSLSVTSDTSTTQSTDPPHDYKTVFTNLSSDTLHIRWIRTDDLGNPSAWEITTCDFIQCWLPHVITQDNDIPPGAFFDFKTTLDPKATVGTGTASTIFFEIADSAATVQTHTLVHTHN
jgi:hypothetical protein